MRITVAIAVILAGSTILSGQAPPMPKPGPEHQRLGVFVGNWTFTGEMKLGPMGQVSGLEVMTYDSAKKAYTYNFFDSTRLR